MNYINIVQPLIGAGIGYITNWIAIKMLFRPLNPIKIGNVKLPFTPGIIPKNKDRIAKSIADTVTNNLLTENDLKETLLTEEFKEKINLKFQEIIKQHENETLNNIIKTNINEENYNTLYNFILENLTIYMFNTIKNADLGSIISEQIETVAREKIKGSFLGIFGGNSIISNIVGNTKLSINEYIESNGENLIKEKIRKELNIILEKDFLTISTSIREKFNFSEIFFSLYENFILEKLGYILKVIDISKIIEEKIKKMDMLELEKLILKIMKKELNSVVNLGALIGFVLGLLNLLF